MTKEKIKIMNWRNGLLLSTVSYVLYLIIWLILDDETADQLPGMAAVDYIVDFYYVCSLPIYLWGFLISFLRFCRSGHLMYG